MSFDPKILVKLEGKERGKETLIMRGDLVELKFNSYAAHLLLFNINDKIPTFNHYVQELVMGSDNVLEAIQGLDQMIYKDTRLSDYLGSNVVECLVKILKESGNVLIQTSAAYILSWVKIDTCHTIIRDKAIPVLVHLLSSTSSIIALPVVISLTRVACHFPYYVSVIIEQGAFEALQKIVLPMNKGTTMFDNLAKFMAIVCRAKVFLDKECICLAIIDGIFYRGLGTNVHIERACYALQYLSYERCMQIQEGTMKTLTQYSCNKDNAVAASALGVLSNIVRWGDFGQIEILAKEPDILRCLQTSLSGRPMKLQWEVCKIISKIADQSQPFAQLAEKVFRNHTQKLVGENISAFLHTLKPTKRAMQNRQPIIEELNKILEFNALLTALKEHHDTRNFAGGLGTVSFLDGDTKMDDLKLWFTTYVTDSLSRDRMEEDKLAALEQLRIIFGLSEIEADSIRSDITSKVYRELLARSITGGRLEAAKSKKVFLENLCNELYFDVQKAVEIHEEIYQQKLKQSVSKGKLSEKDVKSLDDTQIMLCIPEQTVKSAQIYAGFSEKDVQNSRMEQSSAFPDLC